VDVTNVVEQYSQKLVKSDLPKLLFYAQPGGLIPSKTVEWCRQHFKNIKTIDIGPGIHYLQEDNPQLIGSELAQWYKNLK
jgi:haloalkane dehalogenase